MVPICGMGGLRERSIIILNLIASLGRQYSTMRNTRGVGRGLINLTAPTVEKRNEIRGMTNGEVAKELYDVQKKKKSKCLVPLDDIWTTSAWDRLKAAFPEDETSSKILFTTHQKMVALHADKNGLLHEPRCHNDYESGELFQKKSSFQTHVTGNLFLLFLQYEACCSVHHLHFFLFFLFFKY